jgi:hypothetical protein
VKIIEYGAFSNPRRSSRQIILPKKHLNQKTICWAIGKREECENTILKDEYGNVVNYMDLPIT